MASNAAEIFEAIKLGAEEHHAQLAADNRQLANAIAEDIRAEAPVGTEGDPTPGTFRDSIYVGDHADVDGLPASVVGSSDPKASFKEFGTARTPKHATFARVAERYNQDRAYIPGGG